MATYIMTGLVCLTVLSFFAARYRAAISVDGNLSQLHSLPFYHGLNAALKTALAGLGTFIVLAVIAGYWIDHSLWAQLPAHVQALPALDQQHFIEDGKQLALGKVVSTMSDAADIAARKQIATTYAHFINTRNWGVGICSLGVALLVALYALRQVAPRYRARHGAERILVLVLSGAAIIAILATIGIALSLIGETVKFFSQVPVIKFLFGMHWNPLSGVFHGKLNPDSIGAVPLFVGTFMITVIAMLVAVPVGLMIAIFLSDYATHRTRSWAKPVLELLAGIPTVVYGFFAIVTVAPFIRQAGEALGLDVASESALAAGLVMGIMIIPFISSLSDDVINAVPQTLRDGALALGATKSETITQVVLPAALPGIVSSVLLGVSRAIGETMIVVMAAGQSANLSFNPLDAVTTVTVQIVALITGDTEADTAAGPAFALGFTLFCLTLVLNIFALIIVQKYRQKYD